MKLISFISAAMILMAIPSECGWWKSEDLDIMHEEPGSSDDERDPDSTVHIRVLTDVEVELPPDSLEHVKIVRDNGTKHPVHRSTKKLILVENELNETDVSPCKTWLAKDENGRLYRIVNTSCRIDTDGASSISIAPVNVIADLGSETRLECSTVSNASSISWEFVAEKEDDQDSPVTIVTGCAVPEDFRKFYDVNSTSVGQCDLVIPSVTSKNVGIYTCKDSTASRSALFGVIDTSTFVCSSSTPADHSSAKLTCGTTFSDYTTVLPYFANPELTWSISSTSEPPDVIKYNIFKNNLPWYASSSIITKIIDGNIPSATCTFSYHIIPKDLPTTMATNTPYYTASCSTEDIKLPDAPSITIAPKNLVVDLGSEATLACSTNSDASSIAWEFVAVSKGKLVDPVTIVKSCAVGRDYQLLYDVRSLDGHQCDLVISTVYPEHVGVYTCKVSKVSRSAMFGIIDASKCACSPSEYSDDRLTCTTAFSTFTRVLPYFTYPELTWSPSSIKKSNTLEITQHVLYENNLPWYASSNITTQIIDGHDIPPMVCLLSYRIQPENLPATMATNIPSYTASCSTKDIQLPGDASSISMAPENTVAERGGKATLTCTTVSGASSISWEFVAVSKYGQSDPVVIVSNCVITRGSYGIDSSLDGQCDLVIPHVNPNQAGVYTCRDSKTSRSAMFGVIDNSRSCYSDTTDFSNVISKCSVLFATNNSVLPYFTIPELNWSPSSVISSWTQEIIPDFHDYLLNATSQITTQIIDGKISAMTCTVAYGIRTLDLPAGMATNKPSYTANCSTQEIVIQGVYSRVSHRFAVQSGEYCPTGSFPLSCGIERIPTSQYDDMRLSLLKILPIQFSNRVCGCYYYSATGVACVAWCYSGLVDDFQLGAPITIPDDPIETVRSVCPDGTLVIGCQSRGSKYYRFYPSSETMCTCSSDAYSQCQATCASNLQNHEIKTATGYGKVHAVCSRSNTVLGCGVKSDGDTTATLRTAIVFNATACQCYDQKVEITCYAICGQFVG